MTPKQLIVSGLEELGIQTVNAQVSAMMAHMEELVKWNKVHSLTSITDEREMAVKHFLDSCVFMRALGPEIASLADIGTGPGFPGIPLKILRPDMQVCLIEPARKKCTFLRHVIRRLGLTGITVHDRKLSEVAGITVDAAVTRALFTVSDFMREARVIVRPGGKIVLSKGPKYTDEIAGIDCEVMDIKLPHGDDTVRHIITVKM